ncbi:MAG: hypothetical protein KatS3mg011_2229 [Acidimicrobiia bacterium]|nr:MAG: hypothetical protein KatS3mg011_2229 [Acidimicrobiia bacterium]
MVLTIEGEELGSWRVDEVQANRMYSDHFLLELAGEPVVFIADDALGFAYEGVRTIETLSERLRKRRRWPWSRRRSTRAGDGAQGASQGSVDVEQQPVGVEQQLEPVDQEPQTEAAEELPAPREEPVGVEAETEAARATADRLVSAESPEVVDGKVEAEDTPEPYQGETPTEAPAEAASAEEPVEATPEPVEEKSGEPVPVGEDEPAQGEQVPVFLSSDDEPLSWAPEVDAIDLSVVDLTQLEEERTVEVSPVETPVPDQPGGTPSHAEESEPEESSTDVEDPQSEDARSERPGEGTSAIQPAPHRNGSVRRRWFGRTRSAKTPAHEHDYRDRRTVGGITRRICAVCGHISIVGEDVYEEWH